MKQGSKQIIEENLRTAFVTDSMFEVTSLSPWLMTVSSQTNTTGLETSSGLEHY